MRFVRDRGLIVANLESGRTDPRLLVVIDPPPDVDRAAQHILSSPTCPLPYIDDIDLIAGFAQRNPKSQRHAS
jgi:hypothetical protein